MELIFLTEKELNEFKSNKFIDLSTSYENKKKEMKILVDDLAKKRRKGFEKVRGGGGGPRSILIKRPDDLGVIIITQISKRARPLSS